MALATFIIPSDTPNIVESKSFKLYLNSFNQTKIASPEALQQLLHHDLSEATGGTVQVRLVTEADLGKQQMGELDGLLLDRLDIEVDRYEPAPELLFADQDETPVEETLVSHLLKSNCLVTGQPDWGSVQIRYVGAPINQEALLKYLISFRNHNEFHEQCVERIFMDVLRQCKPVKLAVYARYTRRGGLDINPFRTNFNTAWPDNKRNARQ
ncbi:NADPH-dependent 7-cyano-7-deazaguanine reductase [compost metagenome]